MRGPSIDPNDRDLIKRTPKKRTLNLQKQPHGLPEAGLVQGRQTRKDVRAAYSAMWEDLDKLHPTLHDPEEPLSSWPQWEAAREFPSQGSTSLLHQCGPALQCTVGVFAQPVCPASHQNKP